MRFFRDRSGRTAKHSPDYFFLATVFILVVVGIAMLASASSALGKLRFNDSYYYLKHQLLYGFSLGILGFFVCSILDYRIYKKLALIMLLVSIVGLLLVFTPYGRTVQHASRWVVIGLVEFQPAEFLKLTYVLYIAAWLARAEAKRERAFYEGFIPFLIISGLVGALLVMQPATSTVAILLFSGLVMYFVGGAPWKYLFATVGLGAVVTKSIPDNEVWAGAPARPMAQFLELQKKLKVIADTVNAFKSEAVQLRVVDVLLGHLDPDSSQSASSGTTTKVLRQSRKRRVKASPTAPGEKVKSARKSPRASGSPGAYAMISELLGSGFFKTPRTIGSIVEHCKTARGHHYKANECSPTLLRLLRDGKLTRKKNKDGQYEYTHA